MTLRSSGSADAQKRTNIGEPSRQQRVWHYSNPVALGAHGRTFGRDVQPLFATAAGRLPRLSAPIVRNASDGRQFVMARWRPLRAIAQAVRAKGYRISHQGVAGVLRAASGVSVKREARN